MGRGRGWNSFTRGMERDEGKKGVSKCNFKLDDGNS